MADPASKSMPAIDYVSTVRSVFGDRRAMIMAVAGCAIGSSASAIKTDSWQLWVITGLFVLIAVGRFVSITRFLAADIGPTDVAAAEKWERRATFWGALMALVSGLWCVTSFLIVGDPSPS